jgi:hypothetical protein
VVRANEVADVMRVLRDGGAIYTLSAQPDSVIDRNHIHDQVNPFGAIYLDEGSRFFTVADNVIARVPRWLHIWTKTIRDNVVVGNVADTDELMDEGEANVITRNEVGVERWPPRAEEVMAAAGLEPAFRDLR